MRKDFNRGIMRCARIRLYDAVTRSWIGVQEFTRAHYEDAKCYALGYCDWTQHKVYVCVKNKGEYFVKDVFCPVGA